MFLGVKLDRSNGGERERERETEFFISQKLNLESELLSLFFAKKKTHVKLIESGLGSTSEPICGSNYKIPSIFLTLSFRRNLQMVSIVLRRVSFLLDFFFGEFLLDFLQSKTST